MAAWLAVPQTGLQMRQPYLGQPTRQFGVKHVLFLMIPGPHLLESPL
jgi:hypothetical protein